MQIFAQVDWKILRNLRANEIIDQVFAVEREGGEGSTTLFFRHGRTARELR
jgi:hypothetical protein